MLKKNCLSALALLMLPMAASAASVVSMQTTISGRPASGNSNCSTRCVMEFRGNDRLTTVTVDQDGRIFDIARIPLPDSAKLISSHGVVKGAFGKKPTSMQVTISGQPGPRNNGCSANCVKQFRSNGLLQIVALDGSGHIAKLKSVRLPDSAKLVSSSGGRTKESSDLRPGAKSNSGEKGRRNRQVANRSKELTFHDHYKYSGHELVVTTIKKYRNCDSVFHDCHFKTFKTEARWSGH